MPYLPIADIAQPVNWASSLNRGLVSWWLNLPGGQWGRGTMFRDLCRKNDGTLTNGPTWGGSLGRPGGCGSLKFVAASSQYVNGGTPQFDSNNWTVAAWIANTSVAITRVIAFYGLGPTIYKTDSGGDPIGIAHGGSLDLAAAGGIGHDGTWHHVAITRSGSLAQVIIDGVLVTSDAAFAATYTADTAVWLGGSSSFGEHLTGSLDDVRLYSRGLSVSEVLGLYQDSRQCYPATLNWIRRPVVGQAAAATSQGHLLRYRRMAAAA